MASVSDINFLPPINYTSRDYLTIKDALIKHCQTYFPNDHTDFTETGLGAIILEFVAYVGDQLSFYLDRQVNEMFLPTAVQRQSVLNLVSLIGYVPRSTAGAVAPIKATLQVAQTDPTVIDPFTSFTDKDGNIWEFLETITIPSGRTDTSNISIIDEILGQGDGSTSTFSFNITNSNILSTSAILKFVISTVQYQVTANSDGTIPVILGGTGIIDFDEGTVLLNFTPGFVPDNATNITISYVYDQDIIAYQGETKVQVYSSDGSPNQEFTIDNTPVLVSPVVETEDIDPNPNRFEVWVGDPGVPFGTETGTLWSRVDNLASAGPVENVYEVTFDDQDRAIIKFGDAVAGGIPPSGVNNISIIHRTGGGTSGNISTGFINSTVTGQAGLLSVTIFITNTEAATGGAERESLNEIRVNAPAFLRTNNTATTEDDYDTLSLFNRSGLGRIEKAKSRLTPSELITTKTMHINEIIGIVPSIPVLEYFLLLPATPQILSEIIVQYVVGGATRTVTASDLTGGLATLVGDPTLSASNRLRYDEQNFVNEVFSNADGSTFDFSGSLVGDPIFPGTIIFRYTVGGIVRVGYDDGSGTLIGADVQFGSIDYSTGAVVLEFGTKATLTSGNTETFNLAAIGDPVTLDVIVDGGTPQTVTFGSGDATLYSAVTAAEIKTVFDAQLTGVTTTIVSGALVINSDTFGPTSSIQVSNGSPDNMNDATNGLNFSTTVVTGVGSAPDASTAIQFDYQSCLYLVLNTLPDAGTPILFSGESGPTQKEFPSNNIEIYTWAKDANGEFVAPNSALIDVTKTFLDTKRVLGTSIEVIAGFNLIISYEIKTIFESNVDQSEANAAIVEAIEEYFRSVSIGPDVDVPIAAIYDAIYPIPGVVTPTITDVKIRVPVGTGNGINSIFQNDSTIPGRYVSSGKLPAKSGLAGLVKVFLDDVEIGSGDASSPIVNLSGSGLIGGSTFNKDTGAFDLRLNPAPNRGQVVHLEFTLDEEADSVIQNVEVNPWEIAVLGDIIINGIEVK